MSTRDYQRVVDNLCESFGLGRSSVSIRFIEATAQKLKEFTQKRFDHIDFVAVFIDGKYLAKQKIIIALGITLQGDKIALGFG